MDVVDPGTGRSRCADVWNDFKGVVQVILLFGSGIWVVNPCIRQKLGGFYT